MKRKNTIDDDVYQILYRTLNPPQLKKGNIQGQAYSTGGSSLAGYNDWLNRGSSLALDNSASTVTPKKSSSGGFDWVSFGVGSAIDIARDLLGYYHADRAAKVAYERQNEFYDEHLSMPAKVQEFEDAGLNPMALGAAGPGATSAPAVQQGQTPASSGTDILGTLLNYKLKQRELDIEDRRVDVDSRRVDLTEQRLPSLIDQAFATAENKRKQVEWYDTAMSKMTKEIGLMDAHISKVFAETEKITTENFILGIEGKYRDDMLSTQLLNLAKDLNVKDSVITRNDAEAALAWAEKSYKDVLTEYSPALMTAQTEREWAQAAYDNIRTIAEDFKQTYRTKHAGTDPPSGIVGAVISFAAQLVRSFNYNVVGGSIVEAFTGKMPDYAKMDINPNW